MKLNAKDLIASARKNFPTHGTVLELCLELESQLYINEQNLTIKQNLASENQRLREQLDPAYGRSSFQQQRLQALVSELQQPLQELKELNEGVPPLSPECLRQHAAIAALQGIIAADDSLVSDSAAHSAVRYADALVKELAK